MSGGGSAPGTQKHSIEVGHGVGGSHKLLGSSGGVPPQNSALTIFLYMAVENQSPSGTRCPQDRVTYSRKGSEPTVLAHPERATGRCRLPHSPWQAWGTLE